jgi:hypothetical protein
VRLQISPSRIRIPDLMLIAADAPREEIVRTAPLVCVELLSRGDTMRDMMQRLEDYFATGVPVAGSSIRFVVAAGLQYQAIWRMFRTAC